MSPSDLETFGDMIEYLKSVPNCRINGTGFIVIDLKLFLNKHIECVELVPLNQRKHNLHCKSLKRTVKKVLDAYINGNIEKAGTLHPRKKNSSIWTQ